MIFLAIETSTRLTSAAIARDGTVLAREEHDGARGHGAALAPAIARCLATAGVGAAELGAVAVGVGPGLYTGLRVGMATGAALAAAHRLPAVGVNGLDTLAYRVPVPADGHGTTFATVDARRGQVFWARYEATPEAGWTCVDGPRVGSRAELDAELARAGTLRTPVTVVGEVAAAEPSWPDAVDLADLARGRLARGEGVEPHLLAPVYLREADVRIGWAERGGGRGGDGGRPEGGA